MGSSGSKVKQAGEAELRKIRPFLHRRYEELKNRKQRIVNAIKKESTHSRKNLRKEQDEDATCDSFLETETMQIPTVIPPRKTEPAKVVPLPQLSDCNIEDVIQILEKERNNDDGDDDDEEYYDYEEEEEEKEEVEFGRYIIPSSPSFRIYCIPEVNLKEESEDSKIQERDTDQKAMNDHERVESPSPSSGHLKTQSVESFQSAAPSENSKASSESVRTDSSTNRRGQTRKKLRAVKNLLHVKSLYTSCTCVVNHRTRNIVAKATN